jgi:hypothetical protein
MKERVIISLVFLIGAAASLYVVYWGRISQETSGVLANLGTGFVGTALTVLIVDWLYERRTSQESCKSIAMSVLQELDHAVWVWQGDSRGFDVNELYSRVHQAEEDDPIPAYTQNLFMRLGSRCVGHLNLKKNDLALQPTLVATLGVLSRLELIRDANRGFDFQEFKLMLSTAVEGLSKSCELSPPMIIRLPISAHRITSEEHQHYRHFGQQIDGTQQPIWSPFK